MNTETIVKEIIGDYRAFVVDLFHRLRERGIDVTGMPLVQLLYRVETLLEYEDVRDRLKPHCTEWVETFFNGRAVSILILREPLFIAEGFSVSVIELPAPRAAHTYPTGLESMGVLAGNQLEAFKEKYRDLLTGVKEHGPYCQPAFVSFDNEKTVKFYDHTLEAIALLQGWRFENLDSDSSLAKLVNAWRWYLYSHADWKNLIAHVEPKVIESGLVYELPLPIESKGESFAIVEMRAPTSPHYHLNETEIYFVLEGKGKIMINGKEKVVEKDNTVIIPPNTPHFTIPLPYLVVAVVNTPPFKKENYYELH